MRSPRRSASSMWCVDRMMVLPARAGAGDSAGRPGPGAWERMHNDLPTPWGQTQAFCSRVRSTRIVRTRANTVQHPACVKRCSSGAGPDSNKSSYMGHICYCRSASTEFCTHSAGVIKHCIYNLCEVHADTRSLLH